MEFSTAKSLQALKAGDMVALNDERTLTAQMRSKLGIKPIDRKINNVQKVTIGNNLATIILCDITLENESVRKILFAKIVDDAFDVRVYSEDERFPKGNRLDLIENKSLQMSANEHVFFDLPEGETLAECDLLPLKYTGAFNMGDLTYVLKQPGELEGEFRQYPPVSGMRYPLLATLCEYSLEKGKEANLEVPSQAMILEVGSAECNEGGLISLWYGYPIQNNEFTTLAC